MRAGSESSDRCNCTALLVELSSTAECTDHGAEESVKARAEFIRQSEVFETTNNTWLSGPHSNMSTKTVAD